MAEAQEREQSPAQQEPQAPKAMGRKQKTELKVGNTEGLSAEKSLEEQAGVGKIKAMVNPALRGDVELNTPDEENEGQLKGEHFAAGKIHYVTEELANSDYFVRLDDEKEGGE